jgi:hypothetical protein
MFDNLREQADSTPFYEDEAQFRQTESLTAAPRPGASGGGFLGMTPRQRFILSVMLLMAVCTLGAMCLLITGKISLMF